MGEHKAYFEGRKLYGDDFPIDEIEEWYREEKEAYASLVNSRDNDYRYVYHTFNRVHGFRHLDEVIFDNVLLFGGASGNEIAPILKNVRQLHVIEPSKRLRSDSIRGKSLKYIEPTPQGDIRADDNTFDLITCFGVLHHIPNVSHVVKEFGRVLTTGGFLLLREPIVSMGDWRNERRGLTPNERGIPLSLLHSIIDKAGLAIVNKDLCAFAPLRVLAAKSGVTLYKHKLLVALDGILSRIFVWNYRYHATNVWLKCRPTAVFAVIRSEEHLS